MAFGIWSVYWVAVMFTRYYVFSVGSTRVIIEGAACTTFWPLKGLWKCDPSWNVKSNCLVTNPQEEKSSLMVSAGAHRPKTTSLSHCLHVTSKHIVKSKNWGRKEWFLSMCRDKVLAFYSWGWKWTVFFAACNSRAQILCWLDSVWLPAQQKKYFFGYPQVCLPSFFKFCSWIHWADAMLDYVYASHLFGRVNQILFDSLGLGSWWGGTDTSEGNFCCSEQELISWWCLLAQCLPQLWFKSLDHEQVPE